MSSPKNDCEDVLNSVLPFAKQHLVKYGEFYPFGGTMSPDGKVNHAAAWTGDDHPQSTELIQWIEEGFRQGASRGEYKATALVYDVWTTAPGETEKRDTIAVAMDHCDGYSVIVYYPYQLESDGTLTIDEPFAYEGEYKIFGQRS